MDHRRDRVECRCPGIARGRVHPPSVDEQGIRIVVRKLLERDVQRIGVAVLDGCVQQRPRRRAVAACDRIAQRATRGIRRPLGARERRAPSREALLVLRVDDRAHSRTCLRVGRHVRERRRQRLAGARHVEHHRSQERYKRPRVVEGGQRAPQDQRRSAVGWSGLDALERRLGPARIAPEQPGLGGPHGDVRGPFGRDSRRGQAPRRSDGGGPLDPELGARAISLGEVEIGQTEEGVDPFVASGLSDGEGADERIAHLFGWTAGRLSSAREAYPDLGARGCATRELLQRLGELGV
jgi:hypothetical protein